RPRARSKAGHSLRRRLREQHGLEDRPRGSEEELTEPRTLEQIEETPEAAPVSRQALLAAGILPALLTLTTRFWSLGDRPFHHDESIHAHQSYTLMKDGNCRYDPAYHGPFLYYANALVYRVLGASNATARLLPAIFGLFLIAAAIPLARWIGPGAAAAYAALVLISPHLTYFSRFIREDVYSLVFTLGTILAFQTFLETDRARWLTLAAFSFALAGVTQDHAYMTGVLLVPTHPARLPVSALRALLGRRIPSPLCVGSRKSPLADRARPPADHHPRGGRRGFALARPAGEAAPDGPGGFLRPRSRQRERHVAGVFPLRSPRSGARTEARRDPGLRANHPRPHPRARTGRDCARQGRSRRAGRHGRRRGVLASDLVLPRHADEVGDANRRRDDADPGVGLGPAGRPRKTARGAVHRQTRPDPGVVVRRGIQA